MTTTTKKRSVISRDDLILSRNEADRLRHMVQVGVATMSESAANMLDAAVKGGIPQSLADQFVRYHEEGQTLLQKLDRADLSGLQIAIIGFEGFDFDEYDEALEDDER